MCTCCITWWPRHPVFCWIEHSRRSRAVVGYVTSRAHACLSVSWDTTTAPSRLRSTLSMLLLLPQACHLSPLIPTTLPRRLPLSLDFLPWPLTTSPSGRRGILVTVRPVYTHLPLPVCLSWSHLSAAPLLLTASPVCKWFVQVFSATLHRPPSSCRLSLHNVCLYLSYCLAELFGSSFNARAQFNHHLSTVNSWCFHH